MYIFRTIIHDHIIEVRRQDFWRETVLVDGVEVSYKALNVIFPRPHYFSIKDAAGKSRHVEARVDNKPSLTFTRFQAVILVDGVERTRVDPVDSSKPLHICANCGYDLSGLPIQQSERKCPECGRHSLAKE